MKKLALISILCICLTGIKGQPVILHLDMHTLDEGNKDQVTKEDVESPKVGIVIVDPWNYHWCMTACERVSAIVPRWNRALEAARNAGMTVIWVPSDVIAAYSGYPQRERSLGQVHMEVPVERDMPRAKFTAKVGKCMCGPGINCVVNYGQDAMNPDLVIGEKDYIASSTTEVYTILKNSNITHVIYMGLHTNMCLYSKPGALQHIWQSGLKCMVARDINDAFTHYDPAEAYDPDKGTAQIDDDLERAGIPLINVVDEWKEAGIWNKNWLTETVRIAPWGRDYRPYFFENSVTVTLTTPWVANAEIKYTTDGSEPAASSISYNGPFRIERTTKLRTAAFIGKKAVTIPTEAYFVKMDPEPPLPQVYLDELDYSLDPYAGIYPGFIREPLKGHSFDGSPLKIRGKTYTKGLGTIAPSAMSYKIKPGFMRFVGKAGIDDALLEKNYGFNMAQYPSVVFRIFIDGKMAAESPVMRISQEPWRFNIEIPEGSRIINLTCNDAGTRSLLDRADWVDAGFLR